MTVFAQLWVVATRVTLAAALLLCFPRPAAAQTPAPVPHDHAGMTASSSWHLMQDGVVFFNFNSQGSPRGGDELAVQNWWMGMAERPAGTGRLKFTLMLSLEPATLGADGYREIFQIGETLNDLPLIDRQHPHDFLMQAAVVWRTPLGRGYSLTLAGAPVGEPALGPVTFMHRASAFENPTAPLAHHTFDSTHISMGVLTAGLDRGRWQAEGSLFHGGEPDEQRWDLMDPGPLDSWSVRGWFRPTSEWTLQVSHGFLKTPEAHEPGDIRRTTASASWLRRRGNAWTAATAVYGRNNKIGGDFNAFLAEATHTFGANNLYGRFESLQVESDVLRFGRHTFVATSKLEATTVATAKIVAHEHVPESGEGRDVVSTLTLGGGRTLARPWGWDLGAGADVTFYGVPEVLRPYYGNSPVSFHVYFRVRPPAPMGRMMNMTMTGR
jgi:hypothetical protein